MFHENCVLTLSMEFLMFHFNFNIEFLSNYVQYVNNIDISLFIYTLQESWIQYSVCSSLYAVTIKVMTEKI